MLSVKGRNQTFLAHRYFRPRPRPRTRKLKKIAYNEKIQIRIVSILTKLVNRFAPATEVREEVVRYIYDSANEDEYEDKYEDD